MNEGSMECIVVFTVVNPPRSMAPASEMKAPDGFLSCLLLTDGEQVVGLYAQHTQSVRFYSLRDTGGGAPGGRAESTRLFY